MVLGVNPGERESLPQRGVELVRFRIGESWLILVQPIRDDSPVMDFLNRHGEGFFHIALEFEDVEEAASVLRERGVQLASDAPRRGVEGWLLVDVDPAETSGTMIQLVEQGEE
jgi:methylmalonyl-CoA epimerase